MKYQILLRKIMVKCMETVGRILKPMKRLLAFHPAGDENFKVFVTGSFVEAAF